jgi:hypothetical protein
LVSTAQAHWVALAVQYEGLVKKNSYRLTLTFQYWSYNPPQTEISLILHKFETGFFHT